MLIREVKKDMWKGEIPLLVWLPAHCELRQVHELRQQDSSHGVPVRKRDDGIESKSGCRTFVSDVHLSSERMSYLIKSDYMHRLVSDCFSGGSDS